MTPEMFREQATIGQTWAEHVASELNNNKVHCKATPLEFATSEADRVRFENEQDIIFDMFSGCLEVKSRNLSFTANPLSFPYETAYVDTVSGWNKKTPPPLAVIVVSQITQAKLVIPTTTKPYWRQRRSFDRVRQYSDTWYTVHRTHLRPFDALVQWLLEKQERHTI